MANRPIARPRFSSSFLIAALAMTCASAFCPRAFAKKKKAPLATGDTIKFTRSPASIARGKVMPNGDHSDMRDVAPFRPEDMPGPDVVPPESGNDLQSVGSNWLQKQSSHMMNGADKRFLADMNKRINRFLKFEPVKSEPWPEPDSESSKGSKPGGSDDDSESDSDSGDDSASPGAGDLFGFKPTSLRVLDLTRLEMNWSDQSLFTCAFTGDSVQFDLTHVLTRSINLDLRHKSNRGESTLQLSYRW